jgi:hypothetical protein
MSRDSFIRKSDNRSAAHIRSSKQEAQLAKEGRGKLTPGSGSKNQKGDIVKYHGIFRVEAKTTGKKSFSITLDMIRKIEDAALPNGELPAIIVEFIDDCGNPIKDVAVVPKYVLGCIGEIS